MNSTNRSIGGLITLVDERNKDFGVTNLLGLNIKKEFMPSVANQTDLDISKYKILRKNRFALNVMHVGRDEVLPISLYRQNEPAIISPAYLTFEVNEEAELDPEYLMFLFQRPEFDRLCWFLTDSSVRGGLEWSRFLEMEIPIPDKRDEQRHIAAVAGNLAFLQDSLTSSLTSLETALESALFSLSKSADVFPIGDLIHQSENVNYGLGADRVRGVAVSKALFDSRTNLEDVDLSSYKLLKNREFVYVPDTSRRGDKIAIALNEENDVLVSKVYSVFRVTDQSRLMPEYLMLWFRRAAFDKYARFHSWGSARETLDWVDLIQLEIPVPSIDRQAAVVKLFQSLQSRSNSALKLAALQKNISPVLFAGVLQQVSGARV